MPCDPTRMLPEVLDHLMAGGEPRVVADPGDLPGPSPPPPPLLPVLEEQRRVPPRFGSGLGEEPRPGPPVDRTGPMPVAVGARCRNLGLLSLEHPHPPELVVGVDLDRVPPEDRLVIRQALRQGPKLGRSGRPLFFVGWGDGSGPPVNPVPPGEQPAARLPAGRDAFAFPEQQGRHGRAPAAAREAEVAGVSLRGGQQPHGRHHPADDLGSQRAAALPGASGRLKGLANGLGGTNPFECRQAVQDPARLVGRQRAWSLWHAVMASLSLGS